MFKGAFEQVTDLKISEMAEATGRTGQVIFRETFDMCGIKDPDDYFPWFVEAQVVGYRTRAEEARRRCACRR